MVVCWWVCILEEGEVVFAVGLRKEISIGLWVWPYGVYGGYGGF